MAPILSFTAEEIWQELKGLKIGGQDLPESVFLSDFPDFDENLIDKELEARWQSLLNIRDEVNKALEIKRKEKLIGNSLEARLVIYLPDELLKFIEGYKDFLPYLFIVSEVLINPFKEKLPDTYESLEIKNLLIKVERASGQKCQRCWNWSISVGNFKDHPEICARCYKVLTG
jgi:isoleucyl-tRNA synthetase